MEFTPSPSSIFQNKKIKYNKKPTKNGIIWINFSKIRKARCTLTPLSLRSARLTQYMQFARCTSLSHILLRFTTQNIAYTETLCKTARTRSACRSRCFAQWAAPPALCARYGIAQQRLCDIARRVAPLPVRNFALGAAHYVK